MRKRWKTRKDQDVSTRHRSVVFRIFAAIAITTPALPFPFPLRLVCGSQNESVPLCTRALLT